MAARRIRIIREDDPERRMPPYKNPADVDSDEENENYEELEPDLEGLDGLAEGEAPTLQEFTNDEELRGLYAKESVQKAFEEIDEEPSKIPQYQNDADVAAVLKRIQAIFEPYIPPVPTLVEQFAQNPEEVTRCLVETMGKEAARAIVQQLQEAGLEGGGGGRGIDDIEAMMQQFGNMGGGMMGGMGGMMGGMGGMMGGMGGMMGGMGGMMGGMGGMMGGGGMGGMMGGMGDMMGGMGGGMMGDMGGGMGGMPNMQAMMQQLMNAGGGNPQAVQQLGNLGMNPQYLMNMTGQGPPP